MYLFYGIHCADHAPWLGQEAVKMTDGGHGAKRLELWDFGILPEDRESTAGSQAEWL